MRDRDWRLTAPLVVLFVIGILGFWAPNYVPPIAALAKDGVNQEWLGFIGNLIAGLFTLIAAGTAWCAVQRQIQVQRQAAEEARIKKEFAARAILPLSLSALHAYTADCIAAIDQLPDPIPPGTDFNVPNLPLRDVREIKDALESMGDAPAKQLSETLQFLQIQNVRLTDIADKVRSGTLTSHARQRGMIDALDLNALIDRSYVYARGSDYKSPCSEAHELRTAFDIHRLSEIEYPLVLDEIKRRTSTS